MNHLFWGLFFITLDFDLNLGSATVGLLPDFVGWYLLMKGMEQLAEESVFFDRGRHWAFGMMLLSVILYVSDLLDLSSGTVLGLWFVGLAGFCAGLYVRYRMICGIRQMEENHRWDLQSEKLQTMWMIQAVMGLLAYLLSWMPLVGIFAVLASAITAICLLVAMYGTKKRYQAYCEQ